MEKYINDLSQKYAVLDKETEDRIKEFLVKAKNNRWKLNIEVILKDGNIVTLTEIQLVNNEVKYKYVESTGAYAYGSRGAMAFGEIVKVLAWLPNDEEFSRLNTILVKDNLYSINNRLLESLPLYKQNLDRIVKFEIINSALLLTDKQGKIGTYSKKDEIDSFINYLNNATYSMTIHADFLRIMSAIMESDDAEEIWDKYKEQIIKDIRECSDWDYNDSDVRIAISRLLRDKLLNE